MRRNLISQFQPSSRRSGVMASVATMNRIVQSPVSCVISLSGSAVSCPFKPAQIIQASGVSATTNTIGLRMNRTRLSLVIRSQKRGGRRCSSVVLLEVHAGVERRHLVAVPVEQQRGALKELADPPLPGLRPSWMILRRVHVGVEPVFLGRTLLPGVQRLLVRERDSDD